MSVCVGKYSSSGSRAGFYVIDDNRGFKEFENKGEAEYAYHVQSKLAEYNLAPFVLSKVGKIRYSNDMQLSEWGYITEIATMLCCGGNNGCEDCADIYEKNLGKVRRLCSKIIDIGLEFMDAHVGNVGYVTRKGRQVLVCIDCGRESVYSDDAYDNYDDDYCGCEQCKNRKYNNV
jgi:hypothetical protein